MAGSEMVHGGRWWGSTGTCTYPIRIVLVKCLPSFPQDLRSDILSARLLMIIYLWSTSTAVASIDMSLLIDGQAKSLAVYLEETRDTYLIKCI